MHNFFFLSAHFLMREMWESRDQINSFIFGGWHGTLSCWKRPRPSGNDAAVTERTWAVIMFRCDLCVKIPPNKSQDAGFPSSDHHTVSCSDLFTGSLHSVKEKMIHPIYFPLLNPVLRLTCPIQALSAMDKTQHEHPGWYAAIQPDKHQAAARCVIWHLPIRANIKVLSSLMAL